jgi:predicted amidohydrolase
LKAGYLQFKPEFGKPERNTNKIESLISGKKFDLIVMPELANSGYLFSSKDELEKYSESIPDGKFCTVLQNISASKNCYIVSGICERDGNKYYNSAVLVYPDGKIQTYRKIQLFYQEKLWFEPGNNTPAVYEIQSANFAPVKIGIMICFDWIFPEVTRTLAIKGAKIICHPANLVMPYCQDAMVTRAIENRVFTITANRIGKDIKKDRELFFTGMSEIVNPAGEILHKGSENKEEVIIIDIDPSEAADKNINPMNNVISDRREELYFK